MADLYMPSMIKEIFLDSHDFLVEQAKKRILEQFEEKNINAEAENYVESEYKRIEKLALSREKEIDMVELYEVAQERGQERYSSLYDMRAHIRLATLAAIYHQWEKDFRGFIEKELCEFCKREPVSKFCWESSIECLFNLLEKFGWKDIRQSDFYPTIKEYQLVVNVYKHGRGPSFNKLIELNREYFRSLLTGTLEEKPEYIFPEDLWVSDDDFAKLVGALRKFWEVFPERLVLKTSSKLTLPKKK